MRNSKVKGFTLVELIVVIAIIGILAAILVPSMLGYVRNAKISSANSGAKQVHTAAASALTQLGIINFDWGSDDAKEGYITLDPAQNADGVIHVGWTNVNKYPTNEDVDLAAYLGENFKDYGRAFFNTGTYSVTNACYAQQKEAWEIIAAKTTSTDLAGVKEGTQKADAKKGNIYGIYPAPGITSTSNS